MKEQILSGETLPIRVAVDLAGLEAKDVIVECVIGRDSRTDEFIPYEHFLLEAVGQNEKGHTLFHLDLLPNLSGQQYYKIRMYPSHKMLANRFEMGYMLWL